MPDYEPWQRDLERVLSRAFRYPERAFERDLELARGLHDVADHRLKSNEAEKRASLSEPASSLSPAQSSQEDLLDKELAEEARQAVKLSGWRLYLTLPSILVALFLATMDSSIVSTALVTIGNDFDNFNQTIWIVLGYLLSYMAFTMLWSRLSDIFGRKAIFMVSLLGLLAFSLGCALSQTLHQLIVFRVFQGLGGSGIYALGNIVLPEITPDTWYAYMVSAQGAIFTLSNVMGPLLGGIISSTTTWRWLFYLNIPGCVVLIPIVFIAWKDKQLPETFQKRVRKASNFDFMGLLLLTASVCCLVVGIELGGSFYAPWTSSKVIGVFVGAATAFTALLAWNRYREKTWSRSDVRPLFPARLMKIRLVSAAFLLCTLCGFNLFLAIVALPQRFEVLDGSSPLIAGIRLIPFLATSAVGSTFCGIIIARRNWTFWIALVSSCFLLLGSGLLSIRPSPGSAEAAIYVYQIFYGLGTGGLLSATAYITGMESDFADYALASGIVSQCRIFGGCIGLTLSTLVLNQVFTNQLKGVLMPDQLQNLRGSLEYINSLPQSQQTAVLAAFSEGFVQQFRMACYVAVLAIFMSLACWTRHPVSLKKRLEVAEKISNNQVTLEQADKLVRET